MDDPNAWADELRWLQVAGRVLWKSECYRWTQMSAGRVDAHGMSCMGGGFVGGR